MKKRKLIGLSLTALAVATVAAIGITSINSDLVHALFNRNASQTIYSLTLDSSNKVTSAGDKVQKTASNNNVTFTYSSVNSDTSGHVTLNDGGYLVNKDWMRSITSFTCTFASGALNVKSSFGGNVWNDGFSIESGHKYELGSNPYYLKFTASGSALINSIVFEMSCIENPAAHEGDESGEDVIYYQKVTTEGAYSGAHCLIVFEGATINNTNIPAVAFDGSLTTLDVAENGVEVTISNDRIAYSTALAASEFEIGANYVKSASGYYIGQTSNANGMASRTSSAYTNTISIDEDGDAYITSSSAVLRYNPSTAVNQQGEHTALRFRYYKSSSYSAQYAISIYEKVVESVGPDYDKPKDCIGFTAVDNKSNYKTSDVFDTANLLAVTAHYSDGTIESISKGGVDGYSYVVKNGAGIAIDTAAAFGGTKSSSFTVIVSYKDFVPVEYSIDVVFVIAITEISVDSATLEFNTAQKLSDFTSGITADLTYNKIDHNVSDVPYSSFESKGISLTLLNPSGVTHPITSLFGINGTWTIKVTSNTNPSIYGTLNITVNAIPVASISVSGASATVEEEQTLQLTAGVTPNNATNQTVTWSSSNINIATVNNNGLVTGVSAGNVRITATANDGSEVYGYIDIDVTAKPAQSEFDANMFAGTKASECTIVIDSEDVYGIKVGTGSDAGNMSITVGAGATKLSFYAAGWKNSSTTISLTGATCNPSSILLTADNGMTSNSPFTLDGNPSSYYHEVILSNITSEVTITVSASTRFVLWDVKYYVVQEEPVYPESITLSGEQNIVVGQATQLTVGYAAGVNQKHVSFSSNNTSVATVDSSTGVVTGVSAGNVTITATAQTNDHGGTTTATLQMTVSVVHVSSVSLNKDSTSIPVGNSETLVANILPSNATNKNVTWSSSASGVASVINGVVTANSKGTATITVTTVDGSKTAQCVVTVTSQPAETFTINYTDLTSVGYPKDAEETGSASGSNNGTMSFKYFYTYQNNSKIQTKKGQGYIYNTTSLTIMSITLNNVEGTFTVYKGSTAHPESTEVTGSNGTYQLDGASYFTIKNNSGNAAYCTSITIATGTPEPIDPTGIVIKPDNPTVTKNNNRELSIQYTPSNANQHLSVTWSKVSGSGNLSINSSGVVSANSLATASDSAVFKATLDYDSTINATCTVTVVEQAIDDQTILIYMCGSDLESNGQTSSYSASGYASMDLTEILSVSNQPDDVNVVIETGGAKCWASTHGINKNYLERYHVANKSLVRDSQEAKADMSQSSTLQSFITWAMKKYPAERTSLILWNHGGAMRGVCYDENYNSGRQALTNDRVHDAVKNSFTACGRSASDKLEWIGYDACLMQVQDIADFNSDYFKYMVASEESEAGYGWEYSTWLDDAYAKKSTETILTAIVDGFITSTNTLYQNNGWGASDQTLSWLDLSYMQAYKSAWETMSSSLYSLINSYGKNNFQDLMKTVKAYGNTQYTYSDLQDIVAEYTEAGYDVTVQDIISEYGLEQSGGYYYDYGYYYYGIFDAKDALNKIKAVSHFNSVSTLITNTLNAYANLVKYSRKGSGAGNSYGLCCFFGLTGSAYNCAISTYYSNSMTNFSNWQSIVNQFGGARAS